MDLRNPKSITPGVKAAHGALGTISILIKNAHGAHSAPLAHLDLASWQEPFEINVQAPFLMSQAVLDDVVEDDFGRITNLASTAGLRGYPYVAAYVASKHALFSLTRALALELAKRPITLGRRRGNVTSPFGHWCGPGHPMTAWPGRSPSGPPTSCVGNGIN
jgi:NAD(P)-dependent dehydrogenase (short-subunit alcohol dehydrogenase family)